MNPPSETRPDALGAAGPAAGSGRASGCPRDLPDNRLVHLVISPRARGLSVGVNLNPHKRCDCDDVDREVTRAGPPLGSWLDVPMMIAELEGTLELVRSGRLRESPCYQTAPPDLLELRQVTLCGDGEPTLCPNFLEAIEAVVHLRSRGRFPFFKLVVITDASRLDRPEVGHALSLFSSRDEVWARLEAGTQDYMNQANRSECPLEKILANILGLARQRPVVIQSLFAPMDGEAPPSSEIEAYVQRLLELKRAGGQIPLVQIYSATGPTEHSGYGHLPLQTLSQIAQRVRTVAGLKAEVF
jgi:hypothetical protein